MPDMALAAPHCHSIFFIRIDWHIVGQIFSAQTSGEFFYLVQIVLTGIAPGLQCGEAIGSTFLDSAHRAPGPLPGDCPRLGHPSMTNSAFPFQRLAFVMVFGRKADPIFGQCDFSHIFDGIAFIPILDPKGGAQLGTLVYGFFVL